MKKLTFTQVYPGLLFRAIVSTCPANISIVAVQDIAVPCVGITRFINIRR